MTVRRYGSWSANRSTQTASVERHNAEFRAAALTTTIVDEYRNQTGKERIAALLAHPNYRPAAENDYYTGLLKWLTENPRAFMSNRVFSILQKAEARLRTGQVVEGQPWVPRTRPVPEVLRNLPKKPPGQR